MLDHDLYSTDVLVSSPSSFSFCLALFYQRCKHFNLEIAFTGGCDANIDLLHFPMVEVVTFQTFAYQQQPVIKCIKSAVINLLIKNKGTFPAFLSQPFSKKALKYCHSPVDVGIIVQKL